MKKIADNICQHKSLVLIITSILFLLSLIGTYLTKINYDILVYLPSNIETVKGQNILTEDFNMGSYAFVLTDNMSSKDILQLEENIKNIEGVNEVVSIYDLVGTTIPVDMLPNEITSKLSKDNTDLIMVTLNDSTSSLTTMNAISELRKLSNSKTKVSGMSSMVLDTKELSDKEIAIYVVIAVFLCLLILELSLNSYVIPVILLANIGISIMINLGTNIIFGEISYITKALVAVLQLGVTTDFSIFLYHSYEKEKALSKNKEEAMAKAITETFTSVLGSSLTTIAGFLVLCTMSLTLGKDLGLVMAKGVLIGVISAITLFPCLILTFDKLIEKTHHKELVLNFDKLNNFVIKHNKVILVIFSLLAIPLYLANSKIEVYYKLDQSLPETLESIQGNNILKEKFNIVSPEIILMDKDIKNDDINKMIDEIKEVEGIDFVLSSSNLGITNEMLPNKLNNIIQSENYQLLLANSTYDIATDELNNQVDVVNKIIKKYDKNSILAGEGPLMKDLVNTSDTDFNNVNYSSMICILLIMFIVLKSLSLPFLLILTIEFAIITNMSVSYFSGTILPFVAPIVLGTIQLGATIDYAILLTTNYIKRRKDGMNKNKAMKETLEFCNNSIIVSGMCFFAATFGVGVYSKLEIVASLCTLISRGALISMFTVIVILPCVLLTFDKIIMKTTKI